MMYEQRSTGESLFDLAIFGALLYCVYSLFKRRMGWFAEKLVGFIVVGLASAVVWYTACVLIVGQQTTDAQPSWIGWTFYAIGGMWVIYSGFTWKEAHRMAMIKWEAEKRARKQRRQARVAQFRDDYWTK